MAKKKKTKFCYCIWVFEKHFSPLGSVPLAWNFTFSIGPRTFENKIYISLKKFANG